MNIRTKKRLRSFVRKQFGIALPDKSMCPGHQSPMDYVWASYKRDDDLLVWANRGGGKSLCVAVATVLSAMRNEGGEYVILGGSQEQSERVARHVRNLLSSCPDLVDRRSTKRRITLTNSSVVSVLAQSETSVRGTHAHKVRCDEVELFDEEVWTAVLFTTRHHGKRRGCIEALSTAHRPGGLMQQLIEQARLAEHYRLIHWCLWEVIERCRRSRSCAECLLRDDCNPGFPRAGEEAGIARRGGGFFRIDDAIAIKARSSRAAWEAEMLCRGARREMMVFAEFDSARHVRKVDYVPEWPTFRAIDFGYRSPLVCLWVQVSPGGRVHVIDEYVRARLPLATHAATILKRDPGPVAMTYVDPAGRQRESTSGAACTEILAAAGIPCAWRGSGIAEGLELIRSVLAPAAGERDENGRIVPTLAIHPRCRRLIKAFESYHYPPPGTRTNSDNPVKDGPDHAIDALRYFFINRMRPRIATKRLHY